MRIVPSRLIWWLLGGLFSAAMHTSAPLLLGVVALILAAVIRGLE